MRVICAFFLATAAAFAQHADPDIAGGEAASNLYMGNAEAIQAGGELYMLVCSGCHGASGEGGRGPNLLTGRNIRRADNQQLFNTIKNGIPGSDMPPSPLEDEKIWRIAAFVRNLSAPAIRQNVAGDAAAGKAVYYGKGGCTNCHMIRGEGGYLGPDLSNLGVNENMTQIREGLLDVNKRFTQGFDPVIVTLADGTKVQGVAKNYSNYAIQLLDREGQLHLLDRKDVKVEFRDKSWMPDNYSERLTPDEVQNLLAFLSRQSVRPVEMAKGGDSK